jgi:hypothetical protein
MFASPLPSRARTCYTTVFEPLSGRTESENSWQKLADLPDELFSKLDDHIKSSSEKLQRGAAACREAVDSK